MKTNTDSFKHEGKQLEQELKAMIKKIKADTKELKKRFKSYARKVDRFYDKNYKDHPELANQVGDYCAKVDAAVIKAGFIFDDWQE